MVRFLVVPQWQGSSSSRAMQLVDGAQAVLGDLPRSSSQLIDVPLEAGDAQDTGILRMSALNQTARALRTALDEQHEAGQSVVTFGGDAGVGTIAALHAAAETDTAAVAQDPADPDLAVVWFSARGAFHSPTSSPTKAFHEMAARALVDPDVPRPGTDPDRPTPLIGHGLLHLVGARAIEDPQRVDAAAHGVTITTPDALDPAGLVSTIVAAGASRVFIHVDVNVLDPSVVAGLGHAEPFGLTLQQVTDTIAAVRERLPLAGAAITEYAPSTPDAVTHDMSTVLRLVGALV